MTVDEVVDQVSFMLGIPANSNVEELDVRKAVLIAFREAKRYIRTPALKTVPFATRIELSKVGIVTTTIRSVYPANPKVGLNLSNVDAGNVFQLAASVNAMGMINSTTSNLDPIVNQLAMAQASNVPSTDLNGRHDLDNDVLYITCKAPRPGQVTINYVPDYKDVSDIKNKSWIDIIIRLSQAYMKLALGRSRSKYTIQGSNVTLDGDTLLGEANAELEALRSEMESKTNRLVVLD